MNIHEEREIIGKMLNEESTGVYHITGRHEDQGEGQELADVLKQLGLNVYDMGDEYFYNWIISRAPIDKLALSKYTAGEGEQLTEKKIKE